MKISLFLCLALLASCNFKPQYEQPDTQAPECFRFDIENTSTDYANTTWWEQFQDPILNELIKEALQNNQDLKVATARVLEFYAQYKVVASQLYPQVNADASFERGSVSNAIDFQPPVPGIPRVNNLYNLALNISYQLDFWGSLRNATDAAKAQYLAQIEARRTVILTLVSSLASAYIQLRQYDKQLRISKDTYAVRKEAWHLFDLRFEGGLVSEMEVMQAESEAELAEIQVKQYEQIIPQQENLISVLLGAPSSDICRGRPLDDLKLPPCIPVGLPSDLVQNRPDILQAEQKILAANAEIGVARAAFFPSFNLTGSYGFESSALSNFFSNAAKLWDYGLAAMQPVFTGWELTYQLKEAKAIAMEAIHAYQQTILVAFREVNDSLIAHKMSKEIFEVEKRQVAALQEYLKLAILRYDNGQNDYLTVLNAENSLFEAELNQVQTEADIFLSLISLYKALGQGWDVDAEYCASSD